MFARLLAFVAAVAMVVGALAYRGRSEGDGPLAPRVGQLRLACATELAAACEELAADLNGVDIVVEPAGATAARLVAATTAAEDVDGWLVSRPWPAMTDEARQRGGRDPLLEPSKVLARSPLAAVVWDDRLAVLQRHCAPLTWRCLAEQSPKQWAELGGDATWGAVKPGHAPPDSESAGLLVLAATTVGWFGRSDVSSLELQEDDAYRGYITAFERAVPSFPTSPLDELLAFKRARFDFVGVLEASTGILAEAAEKPLLTYPSPVISADVVLAGVRGERGDRLVRRVGLDRAADALLETGWRLPGRPTPQGAPALPGGNGLPAAGLLDALRSLWTEVR